MDVEKLSDAADAYSKKKAELKSAQNSLDELLTMQRLVCEPNSISMVNLKVSAPQQNSFLQPPPEQVYVAAAYVQASLMGQLLPPLIEAQQSVVTDHQMEMQELAERLISAATEVADG